MKVLLFISSMMGVGTETLLALPFGLITRVPGGGWVGG